MRRLLFLPPLALAAALLMTPAQAQFAPASMPVATTMAAPADKDSVLADEMRLRNAFQKTDGASLVSFLSTRARGEASGEKLAELIEGLEAKSPALKQQSCRELVAIGAPAIPVLRQAARNVDSPDSAALARRCLKALEEEPGLLTVAAVRILAAHRPAGTAEALLAYLPHSESDSVMEELKAALSGVAYDKGKADPAVIKALSDEHPLRRASAIVALCQSGIAEPRATLRKLLLDPAPSVRLRASLALAGASDAKAVSTLIALLGDLPTAQAQEVEGFLNELAADDPKIPKVSVGADDVSRQKARDAWAKWWLDSEGPGLLQEVTRRTLTETDTAKTQALIDKLGDDAFEVRQKAEDELKKMGPMIIPLLKGGLKNADLEIRNRCKKCLDSIEADKATPLSPVTARLIALRKPKGATEALLAYMPFAEEEALQEELQAALNVVAYPGGKPHPALVRALTDKQSVRRAAAAVALCNGPLSDNLPRIIRLLKDSDSTVRLKVALALASARETVAVPALISLVGELGPEGSAAAEEYLVKLARDNMPKDLPDGDDKRKARSAAWDRWWNANKTRVVMVDRFSPTVRERYHGFTLLVQANNHQVVEVDKDNKQRWAITGLLNPWDAQVLPGNRVLIAEYNGQRVTERDLKGNILWQKQVPSWPMSAERLRNGQTFIVCRNLLLLVDRGGRDVLKIDRGHDIMSARRLPNGQIVVVTSNRQILRLDRTGKEIKSATIPQVFYNQNEILNNGNVLVPLGWNNRVIEYNADGKEVWSATVPQPMHCVRLPNGNTLVASQNWPYKTYELDKAGKQVQETLINTYVFRVRRR
jgi:HEAT repeat protein